MRILLCALALAGASLLNGCVASQRGANQVDQSLERRGTTGVHWPDPSRPAQEPFAASGEVLTLKRAV